MVIHIILYKLNLSVERIRPIYFHVVKCCI